jgi:prepilin-type N-terminal cleavage/methylation domain-containing protein
MMRLHQDAYVILERMKGGRQAHGFTIVEVMIVLAVTGALFVSAAIMISGRQNQTDFDQGIRQIQTQIQQTIGEVESGYYPSVQNFRCTPGASEPAITGGSTEQGKNNGCIFMGKALQFQVDGTTPERYAVFSLAGLQKKLGNPDQEVANLSEARPIAVAPGSGAHSAVPDVTNLTPLQNGLTNVYVHYNGNSVKALAFVNSLAAYNGDGTIQSGSQQVQMVPVMGSLPATTADTAEVIDTNLRSGSPATSGVELCFASGGTKQSGKITIGSTNRQLSVTLDIKGNTTCS